jgi:two-component system, response regulator RegA
MAGFEPPKPNPPSYLVVDDDRAYCERLADSLRLEGHPEVFTATDHADAVRIATSQRPARAVIDMRLGHEQNGFDVARELRRRRPELQVVIITNYPSFEAMRFATAVGAVDLIPKTLDVSLIQHAFARPEREYFDTSRLALVPPSLQRLEWEHINFVLTLVDGHVTGAAKILGISRSSLYRKLDKMPAQEWSKAALVAWEQRPGAKRAPVGPTGRARSRR